MRRINNLFMMGTAGLILLLSCEIPPLVDSPEYTDPEAVITITTDDLPGIAGRYTPEEALAFSGTDSIEGNGEISTYSWDFGDGYTEDGESLTHSYGTSGTYTIILTVTDINGQTAEDQREIVINQAPEAVISTGDATLTLGESITLESTGSGDADGTVASYAWDLGDGTAGAGSAITHTYAAEGTYTAALTVTDDKGTTDSASVTLTVTAPPNVLPTANAGSDQSLTYDSTATTITADGTASSDSDGTIESWAWSFASLPSGSSLTDGDLTNNGDGTVSFDIAGESSAAMTNGSLTYELTLTVTDDRGGSDSDSVLITLTGTGSVIIGIE